jgi:hypothetical protein
MPETISANPGSATDKTPDGDDFTRPQVRQGMFGNIGHGLIYPIEQFADKVLDCEALSSFRCKGVATRSLESSHDAF